MVGDDYEEGNSVADALQQFCGWEPPSRYDAQHRSWVIEGKNFSWWINKERKAL
jgi:hypothetical protein